MINFKNYARGRCVLSRTSDDVDTIKRDQELSWAKVKELLKLTPSQSQEIDGFVSQSVESDANENGNQKLDVHFIYYFLSKNSPAIFYEPLFLSHYHRCTRPSLCGHSGMELDCSRSF